MISDGYMNFDISELGSFYGKERTLFKVYAPELDGLYLVLDGQRIEMERRDGLFIAEVKGDHEKGRYHFERTDGICFRDPFSYLSDECDSIILDKDRFIKEKAKPAPCQAVMIYEANVRDFSISPSFPGKSHGKFSAFKEEGLQLFDYFLCGLDYLKNIGISYLQLMPVFDYDLDHSRYNWGYNPLNYNYVYKGYVEDIDDPYAYINELRKAVNALHQKDIRVSLDVVFNHVYDPNRFDLEKMVPGHVFRRRQDGSLAEGTFCGNEIRSEDPFMRAYIVELCRRYVELFDIDGLRLDLMGIMDKVTVAKIYEETRKMKEDFILYGEGWNMGDVLPEKDRASIPNARDLEGVAMFNDFYRETISSYVMGNATNIANVKSALAGRHESLSPSQSISYIECHDGYTFFDRLITFKSFYPIALNLKRCRLGLALVVVSRGIPFIQMGQEFYRSKNLLDNTYNQDDSINQIDWNRRVEYNSTCDFLKSLLKIRKENRELHDQSFEMSFQEFEECLICFVGNLRIYINPSNDDYICQSEEENHIIFNGEGECDFLTRTISIGACSLVIGRI